jgi:hypothetical protein
MPSFNLDDWWDKNVDPDISPLDNMYKQITQEAIAAALKSYNIDPVKIQQMENDSLDLSDIDVSAVL